MHAGPAGRVITPDPGRRTHGKPGTQGGGYARRAQRATGARAARRWLGLIITFPTASNRGQLTELCAVWHVIASVRKQRVVSWRAVCHC